MAHFFLRAYQSADSHITTDSDRQQLRGTDEEVAPGAGAWNAPLARTENSTETYGFDKKASKSCYRRLAKEAARVSIGPMPVDQFLRKFLPVSDETLGDMPPSKDAFNRCDAPQSEIDIYKPLLQALNRVPGHHDARCPGFEFRNTSNRPDESGGPVGSHKPDIVCYSTEHIPFFKVKGSDLDADTDMGFAATFIEIKGQESMDCWFDPDEDGDRDSWCFAFGTLNTMSPAYESAEETLGQNAAYATEIFARQHRSFIFSVFICGINARLILWDRAGLVVSERFDYVAYPEHLCEFFWRFAHLSDAERGYDLSVRPATTDEEDYFKRIIKRHITTQVGVSDDAVLEGLLQTHYMPNAVSAILLPSEGTSDGDDRERQMLVSRPLTIPLSLTGRATRAYWAVEYDETGALPRPVVVLKDTWRLHEEFAPGETEGNILRRLKEAGVPNVPSVICDRDVYRDMSKPRWPRRASTRRLGERTEQFLPNYGDVDVDVANAPSTSGPGHDASPSEDNAYGLADEETDAMDQDTDGLHEKDTETSGRGVIKDKTRTWFCLRPVNQWVCKRSTLRQWVIPRRHYRLVTNVAGYTLLHLSGTSELLHGAYDAFQALKGAALLEAPHGPRLHRDVHPGNIILYRDPKDRGHGPRKGYLIDWDVSCLYGSRLHTGGNYLPSLQWQFIAHGLLAKKETSAVTHSALHDMESMFWVVLYCGLLRLQHTEGRGESLAKIIKLLFDDHTVYKDRPYGGYGKSTDMDDRRYTRDVVWDCHDLRDWVKIVYDSFSPVLNSRLCPPSLHRFQWTLAAFDSFWGDFLKSRTLELHNRHNNASDDVLQYWASGTVREASHQATTTAGSKRTAEGTPPGSPRASKLARLHLTPDAYDGRFVNSFATAPPDTPFHSPRSLVTSATSMVPMSLYATGATTAGHVATSGVDGMANTFERRLVGYMPAASGSGAMDDVERMVVAKSKRDRKLSIPKNSFTGRSMCKRWFKELRPDARESDFNRHWNSLDSEAQERWGDMGIEARRQAYRESGVLAKPTNSRKGKGRKGGSRKRR